MLQGAGKVCGLTGGAGRGISLYSAPPLRCYMFVVVNEKGIYHFWTFCTNHYKPLFLFAAIVSYFVGLCGVQSKVKPTKVYVYVPMEWQSDTIKGIVPHID